MRKNRKNSYGTRNIISKEGTRFILSAAYYKDLPKPYGIEYCVMGRSNVGKSSFINHVLKNGNLARVSKSPGKTNLANFFRVNDRIIWVDLPGYGYAKASRKEKARWSKLIYDYCERRENLRGIIWLIDIRHIAMQADIDAYNWFYRLQIPLFPVITKSDKFPQSSRMKQVREIEKYYHFESPAVVYSINMHKSREQFWKVFSNWHEIINNKKDLY